MKIITLGLGFLLIGASSYAGPVLNFCGDSAKAFYDNFKVEGKYEGGYYTKKRGQGKLSCVKKIKWMDTSYYCNFGEDLLHIEGDHAGDAYQKFNVNAEFDGAYHTYKNAIGAFTCLMKAPWGAAITYECYLDL